MYQGQQKLPDVYLTLSIYHTKRSVQMDDPVLNQNNMILNYFQKSLLIGKNSHTIKNIFDKG